MGSFLPFSFVAIFVIAAVVAVGYADISPEVYWKKVLPNTPIPNPILEKLHAGYIAEVIDEKTGTSVGVGKVVHVVAADDKNYGASADLLHDDPTGALFFFEKDLRQGTENFIHRKAGTSVGVGKVVHVVAADDKNYGASADLLHDDPTGALFFFEKDLRQGTENFIHRKAGTSVGVGKVAHVVAADDKNYGASADLLHDDPTVALFFFEKDLRQGTKFNMFFPNSKSDPKFLPRNVVDAIPFSSAKISETLKHFSIEPNSQDAQTMMKTIKECEEPALKGETKYCATSLESMVDFAKSKLGANIKALATETEKEAPKQLYTIAPGVNKMASPKYVACHIESYVHAVYYCHEISDTTAYVVPLVGKDKVKVDAVAVCHKDTSHWNPKHMAFLQLKVKPGSGPICHFIHRDNIVWAQN